MAIDDEVLAVLPLEPGRLGRDIALDDRRVAPSRLLQGVREDVFADVVDPGAVLAGLMGKGSREELVRVPPHQHRVSCGEQLQRVPFCLLVEVLSGPDVGVSENPVEGYEGGFYDLAHGSLLLR